MTNEDILPSDAPRVHHEILGQWLKIKRERQPLVTDFDFESLHPGEHEPYEIVASFDSDGEATFRYGRVTASAEQRFGVRLTGMEVKEVVDARQFASFAANYLFSIQTGQPHYCERFSSLYGREPQHYKRLLLPLANEEGIDGWLLSSMVCPFHEGF